MKYLKRFNKTSDYEAFKNGKDYVTPNVTYISEIKGFRFNPKTKPVVPPSEPTLAMAGDVAYWDGSKVKTTPLSSWNTTLGTPVGVVVVPEGFAPDGKVRIIGLKPVDKNGNQSNSHFDMEWGPYRTDTSLANFATLPITDNAGSTSSGSNYYGFLPSDSFTGATSFVDPKAKYYNTPYVPSPYLGDAPNPEYYKTILGNNVLSDFIGLSNTQTLVGLGTGYTAANAAYRYNDGASNLQWYLPAMGELGYLMSRFNEINNTITTLGGVAIASDVFWSSSESSTFSAYRLDTNGGIVGDDDKDYNYVVRPFAILDDGEDSGGSSKTINYIRMSYREDGPDEYSVNFVADFVPTSKITFEMTGRESTMDGVTGCSLNMVLEVPTLERLTYSPKEDDTYIYKVIMA